MKSQYYPRCNHFCKIEIPRNKTQRVAYLSACTAFTHYLTAFLTHVKDFQKCDLDREELRMSAQDYKEHVLQQLHTEFRTHIPNKLEHFESKLNALNAVLRDYPILNAEHTRDSDTMNACPPLELFLRCIFLETDTEQLGKPWPISKWNELTVL